MISDEQKDKAIEDAFQSKDKDTKEALSKFLSAQFFNGSVKGDSKPRAERIAILRDAVGPDGKLDLKKVEEITQAVKAETKILTEEKVKEWKKDPAFAKKIEAVEKAVYDLLEAKGISTGQADYQKLYNEELLSRLTKTVGATNTVYLSDEKRNANKEEAVDFILDDLKDDIKFQKSQKKPADKSTLPDKQNIGSNMEKAIDDAKKALQTVSNYVTEFPGMNGNGVNNTPSSSRVRT